MTESIKKLNDFQHARLRTEMYLSSRDPNTLTVLEYNNAVPALVDTTWVPAVFTAFREILDNALDEVVTHGHGDRIDVSYNPKTMVFSVKDNGRGIPIKYDDGHKQYLATMALTETKAGRNFDDRGASRGLNGVGASIVNFCSEYFQLDVHRDGMWFSQRFSEGKTDLTINEPLITPTNEKATGTRVEFKLSPTVFHDMRLPEDFIRSRIYEVALCYPNIKVYYNGEKVTVAKGGVEKTLFAKHKPITIEIDEDGFKSRFWLIPDFFKEGPEFTHSLVNCIPTFNGGTHVDTFRRGFYSGMLSALESRSKREKLTPNRSDMADGMLIYNITEMDAPSFDSQSKTRLINENVATHVKKALADPDFFKRVIRLNPEWVELIYERCRDRTQKKDAAELSKLANKKGRVRVAKLEDACGVDRSKCTIFIAEGDSAITGMARARNPDIHGGLPLRGKVLNVHGVAPKDVAKNEALAAIMDSVGLNVGVKANRLSMRYGKIYITTDADEDGKNIAALLVNFFHTMWPELFDPKYPPVIHVFDTPLIIAVKGKVRKYWYAENYDEFNPEDYKGWVIKRAKGLAALVKDDWEWILKNPKATPILDDGSLKESLNLLFNPKLADQRKDWIGM